ncbi:N(4)-(Beta-N-acetylglucosaminyl)-L-asparaginase [Latimeria chalumnae]|uniref:Zgc:153169 n=1 Tax=Latimeria chalumnae TaxID=7897 RepID=M3XJM2_LATCH|nr:PREDICTED: N(4)-(Beta-N-acetylglucosaminyl)-L-asparaginase-like isoform X1 [Latimeria chalumnae]|eukprot:XP_005989590.1 PREDICTED: N(4)-(Beta-N-acetylglucosaminyl)-L-asparaginase-like isoform X1 [Latimeria chalumnae]
MAAVGTWAFSLPAVEKMRVLISKGVNSTDCVEDAMAGIEQDKETGRYIVGRGGYPNKDGIVQCDAAVMEGVPGRFGAVAALPGVGTPLAVARKVMEKSAHSLLVGDGAVAFARDHGFTIEDNENMLSNCTSKAYQEFLEEHRSLPGHDTLGLIALDLQGNITVGVSTSGSPFKYPGRVGDSPLPGCGLYADNQAGAAVATGDGDKIMCFCPTFHIVQLMKQGLSPSSACQSVLQEIYQRVGKDNMFELGLIALNMKAEFGAASTIQFPYTAWCIGQDCASSHTRISSSFFA